MSVGAFVWVRERVVKGFIRVRRPKLCGCALHKSDKSCIVDYNLTLIALCRDFILLFGVLQLMLFAFGFVCRKIFSFVPPCG